jgi:hypothetical protein
MFLPKTTSSVPPWSPSLLRQALAAEIAMLVGPAESDGKAPPLVNANQANVLRKAIHAVPEADPCRSASAFASFCDATLGRLPAQVRTMVLGELACMDAQRAEAFAKLRMIEGELASLDKRIEDTKQERARADRANDKVTITGLSTALVVLKKERAEFERAIKTIESNLRA